MDLEQTKTKTNTTNKAPITEKTSISNSLADSINGASNLSFEDVLISQNLISQNQLELVKIESVKTGKPLDQILQELNLVSQEDIVRTWGIVLNLPYINLQNQIIPQEVLRKIPEGVAKNYQIIAFDEMDGRLKVALVNPKNLQALEALEFIKEKNNFKVDLYITSTPSIQSVLNQYSGSLTAEVSNVLKDVNVDLNVDEAVDEDVENPKDLGKIIQEAPISKAVAVIIKYAVQSRASDIHIEPQENDVKIRYRIDGILQHTVSLPKSVHAAIISRIKILSNLKIDEQRIPQDGRFHTIVADKEIDFRVSTLPTANGEKVVMRLLDKSAGILTLEKLGLQGKGFDILSANIKKPHGMILVTGPTGSGKSTTLYAIIDKINDVGINIVTLEDPIEYYIKGVNQSQIRPDIGFTFANGLRSIVRQDPDVIMVGEIRDLETAEMAVHAALTGHVVLSTLHTNDAVGAVPRLIDMGIEPFLIASSVNVVVAQRLVRKICEKCKESYPATSEMQKEFEEEIEKLPEQEKKNINLTNPLMLYRGKGCNECNNTGFKGRLGIFEVLPMEDEIEELTLKKVPASKIQEQAIKLGMITMKQDGIIKVLTGITTMEEVLRVSINN